MQVVGKRLAPYITIRVMGLAHTAQAKSTRMRTRPWWLSSTAGAIKHTRTRFLSGSTAS